MLVFLPSLLQLIPDLVCWLLRIPDDLLPPLLVPSTAMKASRLYCERDGHRRFSQDYVLTVKKKKPRHDSRQTKIWKKTNDSETHAVPATANVHAHVALRRGLKKSSFMPRTRFPQIFPPIEFPRNLSQASYHTMR